jgi:hypothetical protein
MLSMGRPIDGWDPRPVALARRAARIRRGVDRRSPPAESEATLGVENEEMMKIRGEVPA